MASISRGLGGDDTGYATLRDGMLNDLSEARSILLLVVDGLGERYLQAQGQGGALIEHLRARLTSVCPSTTATAIPAFLTGVPPLQHGFTGWFTWFSELGSQLTVLPFHTRLGGLLVPPAILSPADLSGATPFSDRLPVASHILMPERLSDSCFNRAFAGQAIRTGYRGLDGLAERIRQRINDSTGRNYLYAYWSEFDALAHEYGVGSMEAQDHLRLLDRFFSDLLLSLQGSDTAVLVTADHGFIDTRPASRLRLEAHPQLASMLMMPLCGEPRLAFCYVDPPRHRAFEQYVAEHFSQEMQLYPSRRLLEEGWFGLGAPHPRLAERIGHYALVMRDDYCISGQIPGERPLQHIGVHGGVSAAEMYVPLIYAHV